MTEQNEPSMEDILASIRNILADGEEGNVSQKMPEEKKEQAGRSEQVKEKPEERPVFAAEDTVEESDVMDLTEDMVVQEAPHEPEEESEDDFVPEPVLKPKAVAVFDDKKEIISPVFSESVFDKEENETLLSEPAVEATAASLSHLTRMFASDRKAGLGTGSITIESMVREMLKPFLKEWLDKNLPDIVERVVKKEIARVMDRLDLK